ncbi:energy transducer TonB [Tsuneonella mangrovi]|uniref:energy transducer TonB n=1 Tax=Tsuneonella mangrovi TaxID=1982042 RepID=UPI001470C810|nr:energy transducer TonB [Tsuneonella mangrovi]
MAYLNQANWKDRPGVAIAVVAVHAAIGYALITGLSFVTTFTVPPRLEGETVIDLPTDPPKPTPSPKVEHPIEQLIETPVPQPPIPPLDLGAKTSPIDSTNVTLPPIPLDGLGPVIGPKQSPFEPVAARPRNDSTKWVTNADYRGNWIRRDMSGVARFRLDIAADGSVTDCTITRSSGYAELDAATCGLVTRRARFDPARDSDGKPVSGTYSSAVLWQLPD